MKSLSTSNSKKMFFYFLVVLVSIILQSNINSFAQSTNANDEYSAFAEQMPEVVGGLPAIYKHITEYPRIAKASGIEGKVYCLAFVNENGSVDDVKLVKGIGGGCDEAACDAIKKVSFKPGTSKGQNIKVKMTLAIVFKIK